MTDQFPPARTSVAEQMADAIIACLEEAGRCRIMDIRDRGFSLDDIARHWPEACRLVETKRPKPKNHW